MKPGERERFDKVLEEVLADLPKQARDLLDEVPLVVEDYPSRRVMEDMGLEYREGLCGLYQGIPLTKRSVEHSGVLSDVITIFREGILAAAENRHGDVPPAELRRQIRITVLHEIGHHFGLDEDDLRELGYG